jgi:hypothetical protein
MHRAFEHIGSLQIRGGDKWRTTFETSQSESRFKTKRLLTAKRRAEQRVHASTAASFQDEAYRKE